jgi:ferritin-like metal-binding protein YciE
MLEVATDATLQASIERHIAESEQQVKNLE